MKKMIFRHFTLFCFLLTFGAFGQPANGMYTDLELALKHPKKVKQLDLSKQANLNLTSEFIEFHHLTWFEAQECNLKNFPAPLCHLKQLNIVSLSHNELTSLPDCIAEIQALGLLDLTQNQLTNLPDAFGQLKNLHQLSLDQNQFSTFPMALIECENLELFSMSENQLTELPVEIGQLSQLAMLHLYNNRLQTLPSSVSNLKNLRYVDLRDNPISEDQRAYIRSLLPSECEIQFE